MAEKQSPVGTCDFHELHLENFTDIKTHVFTSSTVTEQKRRYTPSGRKKFLPEFFKVFSNGTTYRLKIRKSKSGNTHSCNHSFEIESNYQKALVLSFKS